jgi:hypothetical protein
MLSGRRTYASDLITIGRNLMDHSILTYALRQSYFTSGSITLGRNVIYHFIMTNAFRQMYVYK